MLKDDNIMNVYYKFYICQLKAATPYSEFLPKIKAELKQLEEEVFNIKDSSSPSKQKTINNNLSQNQNDEMGRNLNYLAQTINQYENIDFERNADDNYMKHIIVYEKKFYSKVNILGIIYGFDISSRSTDNKRYILRVDDGTGRILVTFWEKSKFIKKNYNNTEIEKELKAGVKINIFGKITFFNGDIQIIGEKYILVNNYYAENLFNEILIQEQQVLANIQKNNKGQINYSDTNNLLKKIKEKYYTPYNIKLEKNNYVNENNNSDNILNGKNSNNNINNNYHTRLILKIKNNINSNNEDNNNTSISNNQTNKNNIDPTFEYNVRKFANYLLLVLDEKDLIESNNLKYIVDDNEINTKDENNNKNDNNINEENNKMDIDYDKDVKKEEKINDDKNNNNENINDINQNGENQTGEEKDIEKDIINDILEKEFMMENEMKDELEENKDIDLDDFLNCLTEEEKPFNIDDENIPRGVNPTPIKDAKYLRVKLKYLLSDLRIYGLMKHYIPSIDENDPKTIIPVFKIVINKFEQNMIGKNITKEKDENYLENEVEFDVRFIDKLKEQIKNIIKKKNGEKIDFYDIKHIISSKYNQLLLDKIIKLLLQSLVNTGEIYMEDKHAYKYLFY